MRRINLEDTFKFARIIKAGKLENMFDKLTSELSKFIDAQSENTSELRDKAKSTKDELQEKIGYKIIFGVINAAAEAGVESQVYDLLEGITEKNNIKNQTLSATVEDLKQIAEDNNLKAFFSSARLLI